MLLKEENKNKNNKRKDNPRELPPLRKEDQRLEEKLPRKEETDLATSLKTWKTPSEELTMLGSDKKKNSLSFPRLMTMMMKTTKNEVCSLQNEFVSYT